MKDFFKVSELHEVFNHIKDFHIIGKENVSILELNERVIASDLISDIDLPDFDRATMDGYALCASSTYGATEASPAYLTVNAKVEMGQVPDFTIKKGESARISTGGMLPEGSDCVVMIEHTSEIDNENIEIYKSVAPGNNTIIKGEDFKKGEIILFKGQKIRAQEIGLLAAFGRQSIEVYKKPTIGIISTGDEIIPIDQTPKHSQIRDINTYTLVTLIKNSGGIPIIYGIIEDEYDVLLKQSNIALAECDMVLISGGSSVGTRDYTINAVSSLKDSKILVHGIAISPGKPTILAKVHNKAVWGLPGHVASAMIVFTVVVKPFIEHISGNSNLYSKPHIFAKLTKNVSSAHGRLEYIRVKLIKKNDELFAEPVLGKSGLINTMVKADGIVEIDINKEGLYKDSIVKVTLI